MHKCNAKAYNSLRENKIISNRETMKYFQHEKKKEKMREAQYLGYIVLLKHELTDFLPW